MSGFCAQRIGKMPAKYPASPMSRLDFGAVQTRSELTHAYSLRSSKSGRPQSEAALEGELTDWREYALLRQSDFLKFI